MNNAVRPEYAPCEPDFEVDVNSPLAKLMCSLSAEDAQTNKKMLVESLNILSACYCNLAGDQRRIRGFIV